MMVLNVKQLCLHRGIKHPLAALKKVGISYKLGSAYLNEKKPTIVIAHIEKLCLLLRCTPNDLLRWEPDEKVDDYPENPLQAIRKKTLIPLEERLQNMSIEEIERRLGG